MSDNNRTVESDKIMKWGIAKWGKDDVLTYDGCISAITEEEIAIKLNNLELLTSKVNNLWDGYVKPERAEVERLTLLLQERQSTISRLESEDRELKEENKEARELMKEVCTQRIVISSVMTTSEAKDIMAKFSKIESFLSKSKRQSNPQPET